MSWSEPTPMALWIVAVGTSRASPSLVLERSIVRVRPGACLGRGEFEPDDVLESAMRQFWQRGYLATSVDDLVRATGVKPGSIYSASPGGQATC
jgi:AcrR family transcriptional regulator